jgi:thioredoxin reductase (NADPH)
MEKYDVIIVGAACAGLSSALYTGRRAMKTLVISKDIGGQASITTEIENYPGTGTITGPGLMNKFKEQAEAAGAEIKLTAVTKIEKINGTFKVTTADAEYEAVAVILAFGLSHRKLNVPGEDELLGRGVAYCATCDGPLFKNKVVGVVGGGNSALDATDYLADLASKVYMFVRKDSFRGDETTLIKEVEENDNIDIRFETSVTEIIGEQRVEKVKLNTGEEIELDGLFVEIGYVTQTEFVKDLVDLDERGQIVVDAEQNTSTAGIFAAGDVTTSPFKQAVISAGDGAKAALSATRYIKQMKGEEDKPDWTTRAKKK